MSQITTQLLRIKLVCYQVDAVSCNLQSRLTTPGSKNALFVFIYKSFWWLQIYVKYILQTFL